MALSKGNYPLEHLGIKIHKNEVISVEDASILWPNFSGEKRSAYDTPGDRNFNLHLSKELNDELTEAGWNTKCKPPRPDDEDQVERCTLKIKVNYGFKPPRIKMIGDKTRNETILTSENVGALDDADIRTMDLSFVPFFWTMNEGTPQERDGVSAYLRSMFVEVIEDDLETKWARIQSGVE